MTSRVLTVDIQSASLLIRAVVFQDQSKRDLNSALELTRNDLFLRVHCLQLPVPG